MSSEDRVNASAVEDAAVATANGEVTYDESNIRHLKNADHIRHRPGNYIPDTGRDGLHHLVYELVYNSVDEALAGYCKNIRVHVHADGMLSVSDDGRGIPVDIHPEHKVPTLEMVLTVVGVSGKFDNNAYRVSAGLHGIGAKAVTALAEWAEAQVRRNGKVYVQEYERGVAVTPVREEGTSDHSGTRITFKPDPVIFGEHTFVYEVLEDRLRELAFLNRGLRITLSDERNGKEETFHYEGGVSQYVEWLNRNDSPLHSPPVYVMKMMQTTVEDKTYEVQVEAALQYSMSDTERVRAYANNAYNPVGGTHLSGFRAALTRTLGNYGEKEGIFKADAKPQGEDYRHGLTAIINVALPNPQFSSQTKVKLNNPEIEGAVSAAVSEVLNKYLEENPKSAIAILRRVMLAAEEREAAAKAREALRKRKNILSSGGLPGKLMDCTGKGDDTELFIVEGDSAGGSAESGRDRFYQAILPLRGKPLNVEKARFETLLKNEEIVSLISAIGIDIGNPDDISKVRYGKIVILTDADVDGQHIRTLLLTFFFRQMRKLIEEGHVYVARPPLYKVTHRKQVRFIQAADEMQRELYARGLDGTKLAIVGPPEQLIEQARLSDLVQLIEEIDQSMQILERRGLSPASFVEQASGGLPALRVRFRTKEYWFHNRTELEAFRAAESQRLKHDISVAEDDLKPGQNTGDDEWTMFPQELHEMRSLNRALPKLAAFGLNYADLIPLPRIAGREPPVRYTLTNGDNSRPLAHLRDLPHEIRRLGERGWTITRFKGLGEMDPEELWDTTLDPKRRTLLQVTLVDAQRANDLFRDLMGDAVDKRRAFIFDRGMKLKVADIDYGA